jgi:arabinose-5-phosphate isomerase
MEENFEDHCQRAREVLRMEAAAILEAAKRLDDSFNRTVNFLLQHTGKVILCGVGKSGHIAQKIAATLTSTGMQAIFLHPTEALHGDLGVYSPGDPTIFISRSGTTEELLTLLPILRSLRSPLIAIVGNCESPLAECCDFSLEAYVDVEADPLAIVPTTSTITALAIGDALAIAIMAGKKFCHEDFAKLHPGGQLGRNLLLHVQDVMHPLDRMAVQESTAPIRMVIIAMTERPLGACCIVDSSGKLVGIVTDGDIRRLIQRTENLAGISAADVLCPNPRTIAPTARLGQALEIMEFGPRQVAILPVVNCDGHLRGLVRLHDVYQQR